ncbi:tumor necrosis factor receptor superfamily member 5 [Chanos chanos]|uniref:Tumor necrosis factor receptor superfamily member 5 n=1 Tax=Chanos chanos TaxID=29144 RepID=A0A6J2UY12_CHACN|nr:tumor necrosis factor receptor superfamily member 5-like [Chanos chanos]
MKFLLLVAIFSPVPVLCCDLLTEYENGGKCCKKCPPGKRMRVEDVSCLDPVCLDCADGEYQDTYTKETKCKRQPDCDPNLNFKVPFLRSKIEEVSCICKEGYHCSSKVCDTCVINSDCEPGQRVLQQATRFDNTKCTACEEGTFSPTRSLSTVCQEWTKCQHGVLAEGNSTSDIKCKEENIHEGLIVLTVLLILGLIGVLIWFGVKKGNCCPSLKEKQDVFLKTFRVLLKQCTGDYIEQQEEDKIDEEKQLHQPQENTENTEACPEESKTENGMIVAQERGKGSIVAQPETAYSDASEKDFSC